VLSGIANWLLGGSQDGYLAGLLQHDLHRGLVWYVEMRFVQSLKQIQLNCNYRAPSWSWVSSRKNHASKTQLPENTLPHSTRTTLRPGSFFLSHPPFPSRKPRIIRTATFQKLWNACSSISPRSWICSAMRNGLGWLLSHA